MNESELRKLLDFANVRAPWRVDDARSDEAGLPAIYDEQDDNVLLVEDPDVAALIVAAVNELSKLLDRIETLETALRPFAKVGAEWDLLNEPHPDVLAGQSTREHSVVTPEDFRRAAAALGIAP